MTIMNPEPDNTSAIEPKVKWGTIGSYVGGVLGLTLVNLFTGDDNALLIEALPDAVEIFVLPFVPGVVTLVSAYSAKHQWRRAELTDKRVA